MKIAVVHDAYGWWAYPSFAQARADFRRGGPREFHPILHCFRASLAGGPTDTLWALLDKDDDVVAVSPALDEITAEHYAECGRRPQDGPYRIQSFQREATPGDY